ncbi:AlbA family DNA-binding domain-containing protein [Streptomyces endophytica]|uniref:DNA binding domain-containing protein n=1 Tax=Streptomyces endophytica TaxID=2991496 RepID=A0ABY6PK64_9ACTN|nr:RNA-binding domain-containing protein [Streptomyces endophytica]UZJ33760.1 putative DNA binding domain-containing protein [Streptomyces endophytica]
MVLPARLTAALGRHPDDLDEDDLQRAVDSQIPEGVDLDWKKDFYKGTDAGKKELAKDVSAMANTVGGLVVVGVDDGSKDHAHELSPLEPAQGRGEEWIRSVLANWIQPVVPHIGVRSLRSAKHDGRIYWLITVPRSTQAPHAVAAPGNDYNFRVHVRNGTTTRSLAESEIAQRYRDRFQAASDDIARLNYVAEAGLRYLVNDVNTPLPNGGTRATDLYPLWASLTAIPTIRGNYSVTTLNERNAAFERFHKLAGAALTDKMQPRHPVLAGRRQVRFEGAPIGQLHQDGSFYGAMPLDYKEAQCDRDGANALSQIGLELHLVTLVQAASAWAVESGATGEILLATALHRFDDKDVRLNNSEDPGLWGSAVALPSTPVRTTADLVAVATNMREAITMAYTLASDLLADMGAHEPGILTPEGDLRVERLNSGWRHRLTGWKW